MAANWKQPGKLRRQWPDTGPGLEREQATITSNKIVWDLKDYEPKQDIELSITPGTTAKV